MAQVYKKEKKVVQLLTRPVVAVKEKGTSELCVSPNPEPRVTMKSNQLMLMRVQLQLLVIWITPTTSVYLAKEEQ